MLSAMIFILLHCISVMRTGAARKRDYATAVYTYKVSQISYYIQGVPNIIAGDVSLTQKCIKQYCVALYKEWDIKQL